MTKNLSANKFIQQYGVFLLAGLGILFLWYTREEKALVKELGGDPARKATLLGRYLGTLKSLKWWQPSTWHEDEEAAFELLMDSLHQLNQIEVEYNKISKSGALRADIERFLTTSQINQLYAAIN